MRRTILLHVNVEVPDNAATTAAELERELTGLLEIGMDDVDHCPGLASGTAAIAMAEEI